MERFAVRSASGYVEVPFYSITEMHEETGLHKQTVRRRLEDYPQDTQRFNRKTYGSQLMLDRLRSESPKSCHRVGVIGIAKYQAVMNKKDMDQAITDLL